VKIEPPLDLADLVLLKLWGYGVDHPLARETVIVGRLQRRLVVRGHKLDVDGKYGPRTDRACEGLILNTDERAIRDAAREKNTWGKGSQS
jgi:hypothetical protein